MTTSTGFRVCLGTLLISLALGCAADDEAVTYGSTTQAVAFDGGTQLLQNGKPVACLAHEKWGCCMGNLLGFCKGGYLYSANCGPNPKCGWSTGLNHYACGTAGKADPSGKHPLTCPGPPDSGPNPTLDGPPGCGTLPAVGCCTGTMVEWCDKGSWKVKDCSKSPQCGWNSGSGKYSCGTSGGKDPSGKNPLSCASFLPDGGPPPADGLIPPPDGVKPPPNCKLPPAGCCTGSMVEYCDKGSWKVQDCNKSPQCGWNSSTNKYSCGTSGGKDPSGMNPKSCAQFLPDGGPPPGDGFKPPPKDGPPPPKDGPPPPKKCKTPPEGCCDSKTNTAIWCDNGAPKVQSCASQPKCGWSATYKRYGCGTSGKKHPGGVHPMSCAVYLSDGGTPPPPKDGNPPPPGDGPPPPPGDGIPPTLDGFIPPPGDFKPPPPGDGKPPPPGCGKLPPQGCCGNEILDYCANGIPKSEDCKGKPKCGWDSAKKKYACGTAGHPDPAGKYPMSCVGYLTDGAPPVGDGAPPVNDGTMGQEGNRDSSGGKLDKQVLDSGWKPVERIDEGCSCEAAGSGSSASAWMLVLMALGLVVVRRRGW